MSGPRRYQGQSVSDWVAQLDYTRPTEEARAIDELLKIGSNAIPDLASILSQNGGMDSHVARFAQRAAIKMQLTQRPRMTIESLQGRACFAACLLAESNHVDISSLTLLFQHHLTNGTYANSISARALGLSGGRGVVILANLLASPQISLRNTAAYGLSYARTNPVAIAALLQCARSETDPILQANALQYLNHSSVPAAQLTAVTIPLLESQRLFTRYTAATILSNLPNDSAASQALDHYRKKEPPRP